MKTTISLLMGLLVVAAVPSSAEVHWGGFAQGLFGGRLDENNPTATEYPASETRLQLRLEHFGDRSEVFGRLDFFYDGSDTSQYDWELREGYLKFRVGSQFDFKIGRQVLTWGTGDLIFINDVFAKDYRSFFIGRDDQYLKAPQNALRVEYYPSFGSINLVWTPRFEANRLPTGDRLSYYSPVAGGIVGTGSGKEFYFDPEAPEPEFKNSELALRFQRRMMGFATALYFYKGFYKNPLGAKLVTIDGSQPVPMPIYPELLVYGASTRGQIWGGILWLEGGFFDSQDDKCGDDPLIPNSSVTGMIGYEKQVASNLTLNIQWQADYMLDYDVFQAQMEQQIAAKQLPEGTFIRDEVRHLVTSRLTKLLMNENLTLSSFVFFSPTDEDVYWRPSAEYKYTDQVTIAVGGNIFAGKHENTDFGQFQKDDNAYIKLTYGF
jgi:hypothetical protein